MAADDPASTLGSADAFVALADPTRRRIVVRLSTDGTATATTLAAELGISRQGVAKHLEVLVRGGVVTTRRVGRESRLELQAGAFTGVVEWLRQVSGVEWDARLARLQRAIEQPDAD